MGRAEGADPSYRARVTSLRSLRSLRLLRPLPSAALAGLLVLFACSSSDDDADPATVDVCKAGGLAYRFPRGNDGHADPKGARAAGQARAGKITDPAWIRQAPDARHPVRVGDFLLVNDRLAVTVEAEGPSDGYDPFGGEILTVDPVGEDGLPAGVSQYLETLITVNRGLFAPDHVGVLADGADGGEAIVRATGKLVNAPFLAPFRALLRDDYDLPVAMDYVLAPGAEKVGIRVHFANPDGEELDLSERLHLGLFHAVRSELYTEGKGFAEASGTSSWLGFVNGGQPFAFVAPKDRSFPALIEVSGFQAFQGASNAAGDDGYPVFVPGCRTASFEFADLVAGGPDLDGLRETVRRVRGEPAWREVRGRVLDAAGAPVAGAQVHVDEPGGRYLTRTASAADGAFVVHVPEGAPSQVSATAQGFAYPTPTPVPASGDVTVTLGAHGRIHVVATDATTKEPLPVRVQVVPEAQVAQAPATHGLRYERNGRLWQAFPTNGDVTLDAPPGTHRVYVTRGYEWERFDQVVTVEAGKTTEVPVEIAHSVPSPGVMCADFHIHSYYSVDAEDRVEDKVASAVADGLEIPVSSEHEYVIDFEPYVQKLGLAKWAFGAPSEELTTFTIGHFGVVPLQPKPDRTNRGAIDWVGKDPPAFFPEIAAQPEKPVLIVNHPSNGAAFSSYFVGAKLDRATGVGTNAALWSDAFEAVEVFNDADLEDNRDNTLADYFALLNTGKRVIAVGNSDSHALRSNPVGYPRTCLAFGHDDPRRLSADVLRDTLRRGAAVVSGGITMTVVAPNGAGPGGDGAPGAYKVTVSAPSWLDVLPKLEVFVDGETAAMVDLVPAAVQPAPARTWEATVTVQATASRPQHWVAFHAKGPEGKDLAPLHPGRKAFAFSNPIWF